MTAHSYLKWPNAADTGSWHVIARVDDTGWHLRCGKTITTDAARGSDHLPMGEKSCESCLAGTQRDQDKPHDGRDV